MTRRTAALLTILAVLALGANTRLLAHAGHDHKIMGTVTMAMADHVVVRDANGKDVMIQVARTTKIKPLMKAEAIKTGTRVVVTAPMQKDKMVAQAIQVAAETAAAATP